MQIYTIYLIPLTVGMLRPLGVFAVFPVFSTGNLGSNMLRTALCLVLALPVLPLLSRHEALAGVDGFGFVIVCATEFLIGLLIGVVVSIPFWAIDGAGNIMDVMGGTEMSSLFNPSLGTQSSQMAAVFSRLLTILFFTSGAWQTFLLAMYQTYVDIPVGNHLELTTDGLKLMITLADATLRLAVQFSLPAIIVMFLIDFAFGLLNRSIHQMDVFFLAMPVKSVMGAVLIAVSLAYCLVPYLRYFVESGSRIHQLMVFLR